MTKKTSYHLVHESALINCQSRLNKMELRQPVDGGLFLCRLALLAVGVLGIFMARKRVGNHANVTYRWLLGILKMATGFCCARPHLTKQIDLKTLPYAVTAPSPVDIGNWAVNVVNNQSSSRHPSWADMQMTCLH
ncbi:hypothetical protein, variant [Blastomyces dermatitidis ER-3]|uniref:Uncharacterized protein n=2 Tax=Ajellomyces dermatitidis TaxID=5039 RepID=A0A0J9EL11_AJEDA|nr:hypothetical protein, variant [Blastomyces dermatitidis ER-3]KMW67028.1 hypothetical protein, variant [Blastomyces dermatitidis ATCC 18188]OAT00625.1 hypothetical protein, variant [Blastomyces dermatitidis ER-3]